MAVKAAPMEIDDVATGDELLEFFQHGFPFWVVDPLLSRQS